ncbi:hypothetical protein PORY_001014 [Pneumocystis oryctolagi]|uniref:Uncharacterized protein n=1 Tax=Pneumocystis oryctolagi TaxID=42067 RepID=A0ACB7CD03_9ASCO|nr:hypothetical protein PORY_001014 [Pneumocystis oryctolagi]
MAENTISTDTTSLNPNFLDLRVGWIANAIPHPDADNLYVSTIHCGDTEPRTVVSGLAKYIPIEAMQNRFAMVLAGKNTTDNTLELVEPPAESVAGTPAVFDGYIHEPLRLLPPKKKLWERLQLGLRADTSGIVGWSDENGTCSTLRVGTYPCRLPTLRNVLIKTEELEDEEQIVLQEIPPRSMSTESIKQAFPRKSHKKKKGLFIMKFRKKNLSKTFFHFFTCCMAPSEHLLEENITKNENDKDLGTSGSYLHQKRTETSLLTQNTLKDTLKTTFKEENREIFSSPNNCINENVNPDSTEIFPKINRNPMYREERRIDLSSMFSQICDIENDEVVQHPLSPNASVEIDTSLFVTESSISPIHSEHQKWLLSPILDADKGKKCLVLDLDETLVHSSFKIIHQADFIIPIKVDSTYHNVYVIKRPGVDSFMKRMGELFEIVIFTASLAKYADPVLDMLDIHHVVKHRLFRESCFNHQGNYVKNLSQLGRELKNVLIIDNSPASYIFHPTHAVPISSWFNDAHDTELLDLIPFLEDLTTVPDYNSKG